FECALHIAGIGIRHALHGDRRVATHGHRADHDATRDSAHNGRLHAHQRGAPVLAAVAELVSPPAGPPSTRRAVLSARMSPLMSTAAALSDTATREASPRRM